MICTICNEEAVKYKCPICKVRYCSVTCWTSHRKQSCFKNEISSIESESTLTYYAFQTEDTVPVEKLRLLDYHEGVRATLRNPHVRSILNVIDKARNPSSALKLAMLEPIFVEFVEECLKVVEPPPRDVDHY